MEISGFLSALVTGLVVGALGRLVAPGAQRLGCILTVLVGIVAAIVGGYVAVAVGVVGFWLTLAFQVVVAAVIVALLGIARR